MIARGSTRSGRSPTGWLAIAADEIKEMNLLSGMNGFVAFERPYVAAAVPESALMRYSGRTGTVLTVGSHGQVEIKTVTYSGATEGWVALESGEVSEGQWVVLKGQTALKPGDRVAAKPEPSEAQRKVAQRAAGALR